MVFMCNIGALAPNVATSSLTATSVTVSWTQPPFSFTPVDYTVTLTRVTGSRQVLCSTVEDSRPPVTITPPVTSMELTRLHRFSGYQVRVTARFSNVFSLSPTSSSSMEFATLSACMCNSYNKSEWAIIFSNHYLPVPIANSYLASTLN